MIFLLHVTILPYEHRCRNKGIFKQPGEISRAMAKTNRHKPLLPCLVPLSPASNPQATPRYLQLNRQPACSSPKTVRAASLGSEIDSLLCLCVRLASPRGHGDDVLELKVWGKGRHGHSSECLGIVSCQSDAACRHLHRGILGRCKR